ERPVATSHFGDSGSKNHARGSKNTMGVAPIMKSPRQPIASSNASAAKDAITPPAGTPEKAMALEKFRRPGGGNAARIAPPVGTMMPTARTGEKHRAPKARPEVERAASAQSSESRA